MAMALSEKSRRCRSSMIVDQRISGRVPGRAIDIFARRRDAAVDVAGKDQIRCAELLVLRNDSRAAFFQLARQPRRIALDGEIQIADGHSGNQIAHRPAGQIDIASPPRRPTPARASSPRVVPGIAGFPACTCNQAFSCPFPRVRGVTGSIRRNRDPLFLLPVRPLVPRFSLQRAAAAPHLWPHARGWCAL